MFQQRGLATLMLHGIEGDCIVPPGLTSDEAFYDIPRSSFAAILDLVAGNGLTTITSEQLDDTELAGKALISFDDGRASDQVLAMPALIERGMRGVFFVTTDWIGTQGFMSASQLRDMSTHGMDIQVHGKTHRFLAELSPPELLDELAQAKSALEDVLGRPVTALAYPGGRGGKRVRDTAARLGYRYFFCSRPGWYRPGQAEIPRMVVHGSSALGDVERYLRNQPGPVVRQIARHHAGRLLRLVLGQSGYSRLKGLVRGS